MFGSMRELTDEELARAVRIDPSQIAGLGPSLDALMAMLRERKRKILETYETDTVQADGRAQLSRAGPTRCSRRSDCRSRSSEAVRGGAALRTGAALVPRPTTSRSPFARQLVQLIDRLGDKYQVDELAAKYEFTGRTAMTIPEALEIKEELEKIDGLLKQLEEAAENGPDRRDRSGRAVRVRRAGRRRAARRAAAAGRGVPSRDGRAAGPGEDTADGFQLTPKAYRLFQGRLLERIFSNLEAVANRPAPGPGRRRRGRRDAADQALRVRRLAGQHGHPAGSLVNAMIRNGPGLPVRVEAGRHRDPPHPQYAQVRHRGADGHERLDALRRAVRQRQTDGAGPGRADPPRVSRATTCSSSRCTRSPSLRPPARSPTLLPKPVTIYDPVVRLRADMSDERLSEV